jgi:hypothetical protein
MRGFLLHSLQAGQFQASSSTDVPSSSFKSKKYRAISRECKGPRGRSYPALRLTCIGTQGGERPRFTVQADIYLMRPPQNLISANTMGHVLGLLA